jgi:phage-related protein
MAIGKVIGRVAIKVLPDTTDFREKTANDLRRIEKQLGHVEVDVIPDIDRAAKEKIRNELKAWAKGLNLKVKVDLDLNNGDIAKTISSLEAVTRKRTVRIAPELDKGALARVATGLAAISGLRYTTQLFRNFREELMRIDLAVPRIGVVSHAVAVLGAWVLGVAGNLFSLSSSIASIGKAGLALPGILAGISIGIATTVAALKDFNKQVPQAVRYVSELQDTISKNFWEQAAAPIRNLVDELFPILNKKLAQTSTALGTFFANFSNSAVDILLPSLPPMFDNLTKSIEIASGFTDAFVGIIEKLGKVGSSYLPRLAQWFGDISTQFDNWLGKVGTDGLTKMIDEGIQAMKDFGSVTASTFSIFASLGRAAEAAGGTTLSSLAESMRNVAAAAKSPGFQNGLTDTLRAAYNMLAQIRSIAGPSLKSLVVAMSQNFQNVAPIIGDTIGTAIDAIAGALAQPVVGKGLEAMFQGFNDLVHSLAPTMDIVGQKIAVMGELIGALARNLGVVMAAAIVTLKPLFIALVKAMLPIIEKVGPIMAQVITALGPVFAILGDALNRAAVALRPMFDALQELVNLLLPVLVPVLKVVASVIGDALVGVIQGLTMVFRGLTKIISGVVSVFSGLWDILAGIFTLDFGRVGEGIKAVFSGLGSIILGALQAGLGAVWAYLNGTVLGFFKSFAVKLLGPIARPLGKFFKPIEEAATKVFNFLKKVWTKISNLFKGGGGAGGIKEAIAKPFTAAIDVVRGAFNVIKTVIETAWTVIKTIFTAATQVISTVIRFAFEVIRTIIVAHFTVWKTIIMTAWNAIRTIFSTSLTVIRAVVTLAFDAIRIAITTYLGLIRTVITTVWNVIKTVITSVLKAIKTVVTGAWNAIKSVVTTVVNAIKKVIETVWNAIKSTTSSVFNAVKSVVSNVWNAIKSRISGVVNSVKSTVSGAWNSIKSATSSAFNTVKSIVSSAWNRVKSAVVSGVKDAVSEVKKLPGKAKSALGALGATLANAGRELIQGFINGIGEKFDAVKGKLGELTGKLTSWKGPESLDKVLLVGAGRLIIDGLIRGFEDRFTAVRRMLHDLTKDIAGFIGKSMSQQISDALSFAITGNVATAITADAAVTGVNLDRRLGGLERHVTTAARSAGKDSTSEAGASVQIDNITIPLEDLAQLKDLEEFLDLLRVRIRQE